MLDFHELVGSGVSGPVQPVRWYTYAYTWIHKLVRIVLYTAPQIIQNSHVSQLVPFQYGLQRQLYPFTKSVQVPPCWHGLLKHSFTSIIKTYCKLHAHHNTLTWRHLRPVPNLFPISIPLKPNFISFSTRHSQFFTPSHSHCHLIHMCSHHVPQQILSPRVKQLKWIRQSKCLLFLEHTIVPSYFCNMQWIR